MTFEIISRYRVLRHSKGEPSFYYLKSRTVWLHISLTNYDGKGASKVRGARAPCCPIHIVFECAFIGIWDKAHTAYNTHTKQYSVSITVRLYFVSYHSSLVRSAGIKDEGDRRDSSIKGPCHPIVGTPNRYCS